MHISPCAIKRLVSAVSTVPLLWSYSRVLRTVSERRHFCSLPQLFPPAHKMADSNPAKTVEHNNNKKNKNENQKPEKPSSQKGGKEAGKKKDTSLLGVGATKEGDFSEWYTNTITKAEMIEYYDISGCYILRPWSYSIWEEIQRFFDAEIKKLGVQNAYFPLLVSEKALTAEKDHIEGFAPEVCHRVPLE